ncbi:hypothetical protein MNAN1_001143 [Malassezia nana]|uniref:Uncharacterized protein n=1 Tax=Malassezia nana TaxID=180528 RepID=A0AAF0J1P8_9BASI|nr:hypothetical protein MNAN1_001143 [Malassezia nana]
MDGDGPSAGGAPPPRHELDSDDEDVHERPVDSVHLVGSVPHGRAWCALLDDTGAAVLLATQGDWHAQACIEAGSTKLAGIHVPANDAMPVVLLVPAPMGVHPLQQQAMARLVAQCRPQSMVVVQPYSPGMVLYMTERMQFYYPMFFLQHTPPMQSAPASWASATTYEGSRPWSAPNTLTGYGAAFFLHAMYAGCPALLLSVPSARKRMQVPVYGTSQPLRRPSGKDPRPDQAREQLARLVEPLDQNFEAPLLRLVGTGLSDAPSGPSLLVDAWCAASAARATARPLGDGGMYI